ncbi:hypothetical protein D3C78_301910 [compost metagenome]
MHYYLFYPVLNSSFNDSTELLGRFMCLGESFTSAMRLGAQKAQNLENDGFEAPLIHLVNSFKVTRLDEKHKETVEKVIKRFGFTLEPAEQKDKGTLSMISLLLSTGRFDVIEQVIDKVPIRYHEMPKCGSCIQL